MTVIARGEPVLRSHLVNKCVMDTPFPAANRTNLLHHLVNLL